MNLKLVFRSTLAVLATMGLISLRPYAEPFKALDKDNSLLRLGTNVWSGYEPLYLARSLGYYDDRAVRLVECSSASQVIRAFRNNTIELAALTLDEVLLLKDLGYDVQIILVTDISEGGDVILGKPHVKQLSDLRGRTVGVESKSLGAYVLTRALQKAGMSVADVAAVPLEVDEHERAFQAGEVDAVVTFEPICSRLLAAGAVRLFDSTQIPEEIVDVLAVRKGVLQDNPEKVRIVLRGWFAALDYLQNHAQDAAQRMSDRLKLPPAEILASYDRMGLPSLDENLSLLDADRPKLAKTAERLARIMVEHNLLRADVDISELFTADPIKSLSKVRSN